MPTTTPLAERSLLPDDVVIERAAALFDVLSDPNRLRLLSCLAAVDELCVHELAAAVGMHESTTSHALRLLRGHYMVRARRSGRTVYYRLADEHVRHVLADVLAHVAHGRGDVG
ncbi:MAG: ArsR/SmtB family transcription factor [Actinomycetota bacterium]